MAALSFTAMVGGGYVATTSVNSDFAIHIETDAVAGISVDISSLENGEPANKVPEVVDTKFDQQFHAVVFPLYVTIRINNANPIVGKCVIIEAE